MRCSVAKWFKDHWSQIISAYLLLQLIIYETLDMLVKHSSLNFLICKRDIKSIPTQRVIVQFEHYEEHNCNSQSIMPFLMESKLLLLPALQANMSRDKMWAQGIAILFGKPMDQEDGGLVFQRSIIPWLEFRLLLC